MALVLLWPPLRRGETRKRGRELLHLHVVELIRKKRGKKRKVSLYYLSPLVTSQQRGTREIKSAKGGKRRTPTLFHSRSTT